MWTILENIMCIRYNSKNLHQKRWYIKMFLKFINLETDGTFVLTSVRKWAVQSITNYSEWESLWSVFSVWLLPSSGEVGCRQALWLSSWHQPSVIPFVKIIATPKFLTQSSGLQKSLQKLRKLTFWRYVNKSKYYNKHCISLLKIQIIYYISY